MSTRFNVAQLYSEGQDAKIAALEAEVATLRRRIDFFGVPEKMCLLCGKEGPCDLAPPDSDGNADPICQFDRTYPELIAIAHSAEAEVARLTAENEADRELASLVRAMPFGATLVRNADDWYASKIGPHGAHWRRETATIALLAAGVGEEDEPDAKT